MLTAQAIRSAKTTAELSVNLMGDGRHVGADGAGHVHTAFGSVDVVAGPEGCHG